MHMKLLFLTCVNLIFLFTPFSTLPKIANINTNDLLHPQIISEDTNTIPTPKQNEKDTSEKSFDEIFGANDIFPFLPDNHRDSGTGKFNSF